MNAAPVIIEDDVLVGGNCGVYEGTLVRAEWRAVSGDQTREVDYAEGAVTAVTDSAISLATSYAGFLTIPRDRLTKLRVLEAFWNTREIAGSALVELDVWRWLYANPGATPRGLPGGITVADSLRLFQDAMKGSAIEVRLARWY